MNTRAIPPFRAEHVGSLIRPRALLQARYPEDPSSRSDDLLKRLEDEQVRAVIGLQERIGLECVTDGEFRRASWRLGLVDKAKGFVRADAVGDVDVQRDASGQCRKIGAAPLAVERIRRDGPIVADEIGFAMGHTTRTVKATLPAPSYLHYPRGDACVDPSVYPDVEVFFDDVVAIYREEIKALYDVGGRYLQIDEVAQTLLCDERIRDALRARGDDPDSLSKKYIELVNRIVRGRPADLYVAMHMCRGNAMGAWMASGSYERIAERTFSTLEIDGFFLEYDSARAGGFEPLRFMPEDKTVVMGLVSTKSPGLESPDDLRRRMDEAAFYVPYERLCLSPQCGFASADMGSPLSAEDQEAKLRLVVETADRIWS